SNLSNSLISIPKNLLQCEENKTCKPDNLEIVNGYDLLILLLTIPVTIKIKKNKRKFRRNSK
ncbi:MAG: hypothetical protein ACFFD1_09460, partial [Candidatus Thorarchaeota archaeon]